MITISENQHDRLLKYAEILLVMAILGVCIHFLQIRINSRIVPYGDEGSWLSVSAELARGNGFTTQWLEHPFQSPYALPRPDDYRYPAFSVLLASAFKMFGTNYPVALWSTAIVFILFCISVYLVVKFSYGKRTAAVALALTAFSLLQIEYASQVYCESLFGIVVTWIVYCSMRFDVRKHTWWVVAGILIGILYLVRPNGILFIPALIIYFLVIRKNNRIPIYLPMLSIAISVAIISPWLLRNYIFFGNPLHLAGSAGLLRSSSTEPITYTLNQFIRLHGILYFAKATFIGVYQLLNGFSFFEHGIHFIPFISGLLAIIYKRPFYNGMTLLSILISFMACAYTAKMSDWAGARYFSPFLPLVYAYGISFLFSTGDSLLNRISNKAGTLSRIFGFCVIFTVAIAPLINPHRYFERRYARQLSPKEEISQYYDELSKQLSDSSGIYYASYLAQLNFATRYKCVGVQQLVDEKEIVRSQEHFNPTLMVLSHNEYNNQPRYKNLLMALQKQNYSWSVSATNDLAVFIKIRAKPDSASSR